MLGTRETDLALTGEYERPAEILVRCDWPSTRTCAISGEALTEPPPIAVSLPGGLRFEIEAIDSAINATPATATLRLERTPSDMNVGDRDTNIGEGAAVITAIAGGAVTLKLGVRESRDGWRYRGQLVLPGGSLTLRMDGYLLSGAIESLVID
jgi:hypothetical protein